MKTKEDAIKAINLVIDDCYKWEDWSHDRHNFESMAEQCEKVLEFIEQFKGDL